MGHKSLIVISQVQQYLGLDQPHIVIVRPADIEPLDQAWTADDFMRRWGAVDGQACPRAGDWRGRDQGSRAHRGVEPVSAGGFTLECVRLIAYIHDICGCGDVEPGMTLSGDYGRCDYVSFDAKAMA